MNVEFTLIMMIYDAIIIIIISSSRRYFFIIKVNFRMRKNVSCILINFFNVF